MTSRTSRFLGLRTLLGGLTVAAVAGVVWLAQGDVAQAQTAARIESQTRPNFGLLLDPPVNANRRNHRRYAYRDHRPDWRPGWDWGHGRPPGYQGEQEIFIDCGGNPGSGAVEDAVRRVRPGGSLTIRGRGGACVGWLNIDKPMTIQGEGGFDPRTGQRVPAATLQAPDGLPCISVSAGVRVEIRDLILSSPKAGEAACVVGDGADIVINRVAFAHVGEEAAIYAHDGRLDIRDTNISAQTQTASIVADGATLTAQSVTVSGARSGIELVPGANGPSSLYGLMLTGSDSPNNFGPRAIGVTVRSRNQSGQVSIVNSRICGYVEGVAVEGASVSINQVRICKADKGVVLYNGEVTLADSRVRARTVGVAAASGRAVVTGNVFAGVRDVFFRETRAIIDARNNRVWSRNDICRPSFRPRYRDRYEPYWEPRPDQDYACQWGPYPQQWWYEEEGSMGLPYADDGYRMDGYGDYQSGYGWYDRDGRYVDDRRRRGDDRWRR